MALAIAITNIGVGVAPLGLNGVINRQLVRADRKLLGYGIAAALITAVAMSAFAYAGYRLGTSLLIIMSAAIVAGSLTTLASAQYQVKHRFVLATSLGQFGNLGLAVTSVIVLASGIASPLLPLFLVAAAFCVAAAASWSGLLREGDLGSRQIELRDWSDAISMAGLTAAYQVLLQLERILIPEFLSLQALATFGVMAALVIAPYRSLELAVSSTMLPRLRTIDNRAARKHLIRMEILLVGTLCAVGGLVVWIVSPAIIDWMYDDRYPVTRDLILAGIVGGIIKVVSSICRTAAIAFCTTGELWSLAWSSWLGVAIGALGAYAGAAWGGLPGLVYGTSVGFIVRAIAGVWIAEKYYRTGVEKQRAAY